METLLTACFTLTVIAYSVAATQYYVNLARGVEERRTRLAAMVLTGSAVLHAVHIVTLSFFTNTCPVASLRMAFSVGGLFAVFLFLLLRRNPRLDSLGAAIAPLALTFFVAAQFIEESAAPVELSTGLLTSHVVANLLGLGFVFLAGGCAAYYVWVERRLKAKRLAGVGRLPSLEVLDRAGRKMLLFGFPLLTFGVVSGGVFVAKLDTSSLASLLRSVLGYAAWALVGGVLVSRAALGWSPRRSAYGTLAGVGCLVLLLLVYLLRPLMEGSL